ncbi:hypothetical protein [Rhodococcus wratislaviensis]|uniref:Uncharacterized protein n=1 Tax=Rhodococcus wratislaviensis NBRC 100605 TaxID=1219028 RepID=X0PSS7_RHOWR|nr:hypothetical protein [Rhodococcus wratislaviensis]GAF46084.1 hypothetical protein RW1_028_01230 [Rhodococcus wratislaviensis NBRC 100605]
MMTQLQIAAAVVVGYWMGRAHRTKLGLLLAAASAGRLAGGPQEMVDRATKLLQSSPQFAELSESVRGQLLDAVKVAAMTAATARIDALNNRLLSGSDEILETAEDLVENTADMAADVTDDTAEAVGDVTDDTAGTVAKLAGGTLGAVGALGRRKRPKKAPPPDETDETDEADEDEDDDTTGRVRKLTHDAVGLVGRKKRPKKAPPPEEDDDEDDEGMAEKAEERPARQPTRRRSDEPPRKRSAPAKTSGTRKRGVQR